MNWVHHLDSSLLLYIFSNHCQGILQNLSNIGVDRGFFYYYYYIQPLVI